MAGWRAVGPWSRPNDVVTPSRRTPWSTLRVASAIAWALFISVGCGPYERLTVLPAEADCRALAATVMQWELPWSSTAQVVCQPVSRRTPPDAEPGDCACC